MVAAAAAAAVDYAFLAAVIMCRLPLYSRHEVKSHPREIPRDGLGRLNQIRDHDPTGGGGLDG